METKTKIKLCGLSRECDIEAANELLPEYVGFVFAKKSIRYVSPEQAAALRKQLAPQILAVGVFVNEPPESVSELLAAGVIDIAQLHGSEDEAYIERLRALADKPIIKAFSVNAEQDIRRAAESSADLVLLDAGSGGTGTAFDWGLLAGMERPYFLAGGLDASTVEEAVRKWRPYAVDVSSGIETDGHKDVEKMRNFVWAVRAENKRE
ncbi:MAG: phosphoribosylanthranilate isomerase [Lachnospiraceae bacterium]|nr:phosphoribosylanthranilate isomerase [Lachnospiraceae bacterium]